ncbi:hypothetical protein QAD02_006124 [Eretmocerus hayati]|uniref:Uncharacterized protein n=1 Tax=Eretmocerus hayati TaxID=131215 RepID=A0ACC2N0D9_9HYME|nr:hypothetical protein QAD02_006124 [Eretmocerus hayati]
MFNFFLIFSLLTYVCFIHAVDSTSLKNFTEPVHLHDGIVIGEKLKTWELKQPYAAFKSIPYAKPPIGELRFKPPQKVDPWNEPLYATSDESRKCIQVDHRTKKIEGSEDCLYLNVFTPHTTFDESLVLRPVMVWIHGGAYKSGSSDASYYGPDFLVEQNVIIVSFNYRLGPLGFLNLQHENALGNAGLKDQNFALKWVKENIKKFGGDPNKVTIFGQSAGSVSVDLHVLSDMSAGLFKQSIAMSGSPLCLWWGFQTAEDAKTNAYDLAEKLGIDERDKDLLLKQLMLIPASNITNATKFLSSSIPFRPTLENTTIAQDQEKFLTECTLTKYQKGDFSKGPHLMGFTSNEAVSLIPNDRIEALKLIDSYLSPFKFGNASLFDQFLNVNSTKETDKPIQLLSDLLFTLGIDTKQQLLSANNQLYPVYYYLYSFNPGDSAHKSEGHSLDGAAHEDELPNLFYRPFLNLPLDNPRIIQARQRMVRLWANFAKFGNPTPMGDVDELLKVTWPPSGSSGQHLNFGEELSIKADRPISPFVSLLQRLGFGEFYRAHDCPNAASGWKQSFESATSQVAGFLQSYWPISVGSLASEKKEKKYTNTIETDRGKVIGEILETVEDHHKYAAFKGIPYAKPPVGALRFKPPVDVDPWTEPFKATTDNPKLCIQILFTTDQITGSEDCLYLNVFVPLKKPLIHLKPVMVWIHGGAYRSGSSDASLYGPDFLLQEDIIVVSFNYRLGPLGFLNLHHEDAFGNVGLKDQNLALKWVKRNIKKFGGNPNNITIFGQSAGAVSVNLHLLSDMSVGLFQKSIAMSGSPLCLWWGFQTAKDAISSALELAEKLNIKETDKSVILNRLHQIPATDIINATRLLSSSIPFRPTLENTTIAPDQEKFLTECTLTKYKRGNFSKGPHLMGFTSSEMVSFITDSHISMLRGTSYILDLFQFGSWSKGLLDSVLNIDGKADLQRSVQLLSDLIFVLGIDTTQQFLNAKNGGQPVYYYRYSFDPEQSAHKAEGRNLAGAAHEDELPYLFYRPHLKIPLNDLKITPARKRMIMMWTNFAKYGNPTPLGDSDKMLNIVWPPSGRQGKYLDFGEKLALGATRPISVLVQKLENLHLGEFYQAHDCPSDAPGYKWVLESAISKVAGTSGGR